MRIKYFLFSALPIVLSSLGNSNACGTGPYPIYLVSGYPYNLASPGYPGSYPSDVDCTWEFIAPPGYQVDIRFWRFNVSQIQIRIHGNQCNPPRFEKITALFLAEWMTLWISLIQTTGVPDYKCWDELLLYDCVEHVVDGHGCNEDIRTNCLEIICGDRLWEIAMMYYRTGTQFLKVVFHAVDRKPSDLPPFPGFNATVNAIKP